jgi:hypothetical protein
LANASSSTAVSSFADRKEIARYGFETSLFGVTAMGKAMQKGHYGRLLAMTVLSFISMYVLMYAMVNTFANALPNFNQFYMAGLMVAPMTIIELFLMGAMYQNKRLNALIIVVSAVALVIFWTLIRQQVAISDQQFLKSMIPHHAGAILMCEEASIQDPEIKKLCKDIVSGQQAEIDQMKAKLKQMANK